MCTGAATSLAAQESRGTTTTNLVNGAPLPWCWGTATMESFSATIDALKSRVGTSEALCLPDVVDRPALSHLCYFRFLLRPCFPNASTSSSTVRMPDSRVWSTECSKGSPASTASGTTTGGKWMLSSASVMSVWGM